jgi:hypothetical protein
MPDSVNVHFDLEAGPGMRRHRVSVWNDDGGMLRGPSAEPPADLSADDGTTLYVEASTPVVVGKTHTSRRDEKRWRLRVARGAHAVLELGKVRGKPVAAISIRIDGAEHIRRDPSPA